MSEPLDRARRVVAVGAAVLIVVLAALAAAKSRLEDAEGIASAMRGRSAAASGVEDLVRHLGYELRNRAGDTIRLSTSGGLARPPAPRRFRPLPPLADAEGAFLIRESESWSDELHRSALLRALKSSDPATRLAAAAAGMRLDVRTGGPWQPKSLCWRKATWGLVTFDDVRLDDTEESILVHLQPSMWSGGVSGMSFTMPDASSALEVIGSDDDLKASAMLTVMHPDGARLVRERRAELTEARSLAKAWTNAREVDGEFRAGMFADGGAVVARRLDLEWEVVRMTEQEVRTVAARVLSPRGMTLVSGDRSSVAAAPVPGDGEWTVVASFAEDETRERSRLLINGLGIAGVVAAGAFGAFARAVYRDARLATLRTEFVATVSHELRTPVAVVRTSAETLASGRATRDADKQALTEAIVRESERLSTLVGNVLDFARMESGRRTYALRETDLGALVADVAKRHAGVALAVADGVPSLRCDADALAGAVGNLLDNARKFSAADATIEVRVDRHGRDVVIDVADHGIGVPDAEKPHVFERFFRGADARVRDTRGAGIGLALVEHAARAHGGRVEVVDTPGGGATFRVTLPIEQNG